MNPIELGFEAFAHLIAPDASYIVEFDRDASDSYSIGIETQRPPPRGRDLGKNDVLPLLPLGSRWEPALGWRSFFARPFAWSGQTWWALGIQGVVRHETRGAYPVSKVALFPPQQFPHLGLEELASRLFSGRFPPGPVTYGVLRASSETPAAHARVEAWMLGRAVAAHHARRPLIFRTLVLSEDEVPRLPMLNGLVRALGMDELLEMVGASPQILVATVPSIRKTFSSGARSSLNRNHRLSLDILDPP